MKPLELLAGLTRRLSRLALWVAGISLVAMTALVFWQVFTRYILAQPSQLTEPYAVLMMSWFIFLGAAVGTYEGFHMRFDVAIYAMPKGWRWLPETISDLVVGFFGLGMIWWGMQLVIGTWSSTLPLVHLPGGVNYIPLVAGGVLFALFSLERMLRRAAGLPEGARGFGAHEPASAVTEAPAVIEV